MFIKDWKKDVFTIPNFLSLFRLALIPVYMSLYLNATNHRQLSIAGGILIASCLTDAIDGRVARQYNMISTLGKILDPLADKITQFTLTFCLSLKYTRLIPVLILFILKELFQLTAGILQLRKGKMLSGALPAGKVCTAVLFASLISLVLFPALPDFIISGIAALDTVFLLISFICYIIAYWGRNTKFKDIENT